MSICGMYKRDTNVSEEDYKELGMGCITCSHHNGFHCTKSCRGRDTGRAYISDSGKVEKWQHN